MDAEDYDQAPDPKRTLWRLAAAVVVALAVLAGAAYLAAPGITDGHLIAGTASANPSGVAAATQERIQAEAVAAAQKKKADDEAYLHSVEADTKLSMQEYWDGPDNDIGLTFTVLAVQLIAAGDNKFEGVATMTADHGKPHDILIHVTADGKNLMWRTDEGALLPLLH